MSIMTIIILTNKKDKKSHLVVIFVWIGDERSIQNLSFLMTINLEVTSSDDQQTSNNISIHSYP